MNLDRDSFLSVDSETKDIDFLSNQLFREYWAETGERVRVESQDVGRPDLISSRVFGSDGPWWMLLKYNGIDDPWNELWPGLVLKVPSEETMQSYAVDYKAR